MSRSRPQIEDHWHEEDFLDWQASIALSGLEDSEDQEEDTSTMGTAFLSSPQERV